MDSLINPKNGKSIVNNVRRKVIDKHYDWGLYVYKRSNGRWFTDGSGSILNIPAQKGDISKITELKKAAIFNGDNGEGTAHFVPGLTRISEEEYSEQKERMREGLIPNINDLGAIADAQKTLKTHGRDAYENE